jgi:hypothetical protein
VVAREPKRVRKAMWMGHRREVGVSEGKNGRWMLGLIGEVPTDTWRKQSWYPVIKAHGVHMNLCGPLEKPSREPMEEAYYCVLEQMRGFYNMQESCSLFIYFGWSSITVSSLMIQSIYLDVVERIFRCGCGVPR